jgi:(1->4)-alpha-D-glucan 1-alpha-D-glucosylmutase
MHDILNAADAHAVADAVPAGDTEAVRAVADEIARTGSRVPLATYRVQFNHLFTFQQATDLLPYLKELGISDLYSSPFFKARPDSPHGYDVVDHNELSESIGGEPGFARLTDRLRELGIGHLVDFVPNHMGIGVRDNAWWMDVLENGASSIYAEFFDIDWQPLKTEMAHKVLLPVLGDHYGRVLESGELRTSFDDGAFSIRYFDLELPVDPGSAPLILDRVAAALASGSAADGDALLELQSIVTGLRHLPRRTDTRPERMNERRREKEILRRRLATLTGHNPAIAEALQALVTTLNGEPGKPRTYDGLHELLEAQAYRLSFWRVAAEEVNYRRFFDINDLAAIRMENTRVFDVTHRRLIQFLGEGRITGLRIDHPDGLWDPRGYFRSLQQSWFLERCRRLQKETERPAAEASEGSSSRRAGLASAWAAAVDREPEGPLRRPLYVVAEKILTRGEFLPREWPVHGTSGYDFAAQVGGLFVDGAGEAGLTEAYRRFTGLDDDFADLVYRKKKLVLQTSLAGELNVLAAALNRLSERDRHSRDFTLGSLTAALRETIACFPVYRTYVREDTSNVSAHDRTAIARAIHVAQLRNPTTDTSVFGFVRAVLMLEVPSTVAEDDRRLWRDFVMRFQQLTSPVMAKGVEDTAFYVYNRLTSLNEVGGEPERFGTSVAAFHRACQQRLREWPDSLLATSTHDTKRSEDARARISVLSELPDLWRRALEDLKDIAGPLKEEVDDRPAPDANEEYLFYQTLLSVWPQGPLEGALDETFVNRLVAYMRKATREAKVNTSWVNAAPGYDHAVEQFVRRALAAGSPVLQRLDPLARDVAFFGRWSSLSQVLLKLTAPGVPDIYQGNETWDLSLVDPDNRRPVDFGLRRSMLTAIRRESQRGLPAFLRSLVDHPEDGRIKLFVTHVALDARNRLPGLFRATGSFQPLEAAGPRADHLVAFARLHRDRRVIVVAPRLFARLTNGERTLPVGRVWGETVLPVEPGVFTNAFTNEETRTIEVGGRSVLPMDEVLRRFPVALLESAPGGDTG